MKKTDRPGTSFNNDPQKSEGHSSLFYYEQIGTRQYLRITRLGVILILLFTVIPLLAILFLFLSAKPAGQINTNFIIQPPAVNSAPQSTPQGIIKPAPPAVSLPRVNPQPQRSMPVLPGPSVQDNNSNKQSIPRRTPPPQPSKPPT